MFSNYIKNQPYLSVVFIRITYDHTQICWVQQVPNGGRSMEGTGVLCELIAKHRLHFYSVVIIFITSYSIKYASKCIIRHAMYVHSKT